MCARAHTHTHTHTHTLWTFLSHAVHGNHLFYVWTANPRPLHPTTQSKCPFNYSALAKASRLVLEVKGHMRDLSQSYGRTVWGFSFWVPFVYLHCYFIQFSVLLSFSQPQLRTAVAPHMKRVPDFPIFRHSFTSTHTQKIFNRRLKISKTGGLADSFLSWIHLFLDCVDTSAY